jgi:DNA-binding IclR family transcriptional regulator
MNPGPSRPALDAAPPSQTLSRGLSALEFIASAPSPVTLNDVAAHLELHRSVVYRMVKTLEIHGFVRATDDSRFVAGPALAGLSLGVEPALRTAAAPVLHRLSVETGCTAFISVAAGRDCLTVDSVEASFQGSSLAQRPGTRHPLSIGAPSLAIMSALTEEEWARFEPDVPYRAGAAQAAAQGYALSRDEVFPGLSACAAPIRTGPGLPAAIAVVHLTTVPLSDRQISAVRAAADAVSAALTGSRS